MKNFHEQIDAESGFNKPKSAELTPAQLANIAAHEEATALMAARLAGIEPEAEDDNDAMAEVDEIVNPRLTKAAAVAIAEIKNIEPYTFSVISFMSGFTDHVKRSFPELPGQLEELQAGYEAVMAHATEHLPRKANEAFHAYIASPGDATKGRTREDFEREYKHTFDIAIQESKTFAPRARELVRPLIKKYAEMIRDFADRHANHEKGHSMLFGLPWEMSPWVATIYRAAEIIERHDGAGHDPKSVAQFIGLDFEKYFTATEHYTFDKPEDEAPVQEKSSIAKKLFGGK